MIHFFHNLIFFIVVTFPPDTSSIHKNGQCDFKPIDFYNISLTKQIILNRMKSEVELYRSNRHVAMYGGYEEYMENLRFLQLTDYETKDVVTLECSNISVFDRNLNGSCGRLRQQNRINYEVPNSRYIECAYKMPENLLQHAKMIEWTNIITKQDVADNFVALTLYSCFLNGSKTALGAFHNVLLPHEFYPYFILNTSQHVQKKPIWGNNAIDYNLTFHPHAGYVQNSAFAMAFTFHVYNNKIDEFKKFPPRVQIAYDQNVEERFQAEHHDKKCKREMFKNNHTKLGCCLMSVPIDFDKEPVWSSVIFDPKHLHLNACIVYGHYDPKSYIVPLTSERCCEPVHFSPFGVKNQKRQKFVFRKTHPNACILRC